MNGFVGFEGHILVPFGRRDKDEVTFHIRNTHQTGTELTVDMPCIEINCQEDQAIRFYDICGIFTDPLPYIEDGRDAFQFVRTFLPGQFQGLRQIQMDFLDLYFNICTAIGDDLKNKLTRTKDTESEGTNYNWFFAALLPMANAHLYLGPERNPQTGVSDKIVADILFWTGQRFVAVELVRERYLRKHLERTRTFLTNSIEPVIIFEEEMKRDRENSLCRHLPPEILNFWLHCTGEPCNPLSLPF